MPSSHTPTPRCQWFSALAKALDPRSGRWLAVLFLGLILAGGRRTLSQWIRGAGLSNQYRRCYATAAAVGHRTERIATRLLLELLKPVVAEAPRLVLGLDDTPTPRYGPKVQGAGVHHNPTPGPAGGRFVYRHVWVVLGLLVGHPLGGGCGPAPADPAVHPPEEPRRARGEAPARVRDQTGDGRGGGAVGARVAEVVGEGRVGGGRRGVRQGPSAQAPAEPRGDGGEPAQQRRGLVLGARTRAEPAGRPRVYGTQRLSLAKRAGQKGGWSTGAFTQHGKTMEKRYKTFVATWRPAGGAIRVVLVDETKGWVAFFCTDPAAVVADILGLVSDRFSLETCFRDLKQVVGVGQQQVRGVASNVGRFHLCVWAFTMTEVWAWNQKAEALVAHRSASPWDDANRGPSHADKRRAWQRELLAEDIRAVVGEHPIRR